ncbi:hypothetical protein PR048_020382 [Dryococelus australis]|uniref:DDE Tnp4 domain-containing protein n=1 Tax=Dryococelus australis TaxID=614101 RepID=A0ABQ9H660_9NEOP|nr:hypothetical protein PR048_020382 [Dryococelus australis]
MPRRRERIAAAIILLMKEKNKDLFGLDNGTPNRRCAAIFEPDSYDCNRLRGFITESGPHYQKTRHSHARFYFAKGKTQLNVKIVGIRFISFSDVFVPDPRLHYIKNYSGSLQSFHFPHCVRSLDGNHVVFKAPVHSGRFCFNYKGSHSIILIIVAEPCYKITYMNVGCNGRVSDGGIFLQSSLFPCVENNTLNIPPYSPLAARSVPVPYVLIADDAFATKPYLMRPFPYKKKTTCTQQNI